MKITEVFPLESFAAYESHGMEEKHNWSQPTHVQGGGHQSVTLKATGRIWITTTPLTNTTSHMTICPTETNNRTCAQHKQVIQISDDWGYPIDDAVFTI